MSIRKTYPMQAYKSPCGRPPVHGLWGMGQMMFTKYIVVVDAECLRTATNVHIESRGNITTTYDWKVNAGASSVVKRKAIAPHAGSPPYFQCNISIPVLPAGRQRLYFLPDRILVWDTSGVGAVGFDQLDVNSGEQRFIEDGGVPGDTRVVDKTWRYVNKKGGPDRRFNATGRFLS